MSRIPQAALLPGETIAVDAETGEERIQLTAEGDAEVRASRLAAARGEVVRVEDVAEYIARIKRESAARVKGSGDAALRRRDR